MYFWCTNVILLTVTNTDTYSTAIIKDRNKNSSDNDKNRFKGTSNNERYDFGYLNDPSTGYDVENSSRNYEKTDGYSQAQQVDQIDRQDR